MKKYIYITVLFLVFVCALIIYKFTTFTYVSAKFQQLRPIKQSLPVYYKGLVVGKAREMKHSNSYQHTLVKLVLYPRNLLLPENTTVLLKKEKKDKKDRDFLELIYPKEPSSTMLNNGTILEGKATVDVDTFLSNQNPDELEEIKQNLAKSAENLNYALESLGQMFDIINEILRQNQNNIYKTTGNVNKMTKKLDNSIDAKQLQDTLAAISQSGRNIELLTTSFNDSTPSTLDDIEGVASNVRAITCGLRKTLRKRFGGLRLFFGQVIDECN